jgi:hypothetical protein
MTLSDIATVASIVSSVALTISLVYVALQVRQAEKNQRGLMQQGRANRLTADLMQLAEPQLASIWIKGLQAPETLEGEELERYLLLCRAAFISGEDSFLQHRAGLLDESAFRSYTAGARGQLSGSSGLRAAWAVLSHQFGPEYVAYIGEQLEHAKLQSMQGRPQQWNSALKAACGDRPA